MTAPRYCAAETPELLDTYVAPVAVAEMFCDSAYQRPLDALRARRIATGWERRLAGIVDVSDRGEAAVPRYALVDGQHRWAAARHAGIGVLVANVHSGLNRAQEARLFDRLNRERRRIGTWDHWHARKTAADPVVSDIESIAAAMGLTIDTSSRLGSVRCISTLEKLHSLGGRSLVERCLQLVVSVWGRDNPGFDAAIVHGLGLLLFYLGDLDMTRLAEALVDVLPGQIKADATELKALSNGPMPRLVAIAMITLYNQKPGRRILVSLNTFSGKPRVARTSAGAANATAPGAS